jgi:hypothetical protein
MLDYNPHALAYITKRRLFNSVIEFIASYVKRSKAKATTSK